MTTDQRFPCPQCGADLRFDPGSGDLSCDFCGHREHLTPEAAPSAIRELDFETAIANRLPQAEIEVTQVSRCTNCGAEVAFDEAQHATECPFCATPVVSDTGTHRHIKPAAVLPFALAEETARKAMTDWLGSLWLAPGGLAKFARKGRKMQGVYLPYWTFDARTRTQYRGQRGTVYHRTVRGADGQSRTESEVRWRPVSGRVARDFDDVLVCASPSLPAETTQKLEPWDLSDLTPYTPDFLAGFSAEGYRIDLPEGRQHAQVRMDKVIARDVRMDIGGDRQRISALETEIGGVTFKHVLLPIWLAAFSFRGKTYQVVVNGQTGRVTGERPWSRWKIAGLVLLGIAVALGWLYLNNR
ncbi:TFIIB-type zinc finger domain-containing protein [Palleronia caenipelagi]|uniref:TFIIB-type zinc ribbon-containing protein n=1 Tax=Palleronia caenipelagi TaxID=2489174 RepID=A0A547Q2R1_9RHOB|nr:TFIIB-type zinc finger domain-containing protein [Palleronia caenipelagi]TRD20670.1 TFIIB-type zinc ribbon-containing protein [Palleronia caenipelagi]